MLGSLSRCSPRTFNVWQVTKSMFTWRWGTPDRCGSMWRVTQPIRCNRDRIKMRYYMDRRVTSPTWGLPPPLVARKNADSLNTMILDFLVDFKTGESRVFWKLQFPAHWLNIIFYAALYRTLRTLLTKCVVKCSRSSWGLNLWELKGVSGKAQKGNQHSLDCLFVLKTVTQQSSKKF